MTFGLVLPGAVGGRPGPLVAARRSGVGTGHAGRFRAARTSYCPVRRSDLPTPFGPRTSLFEPPAPAAGNRPFGGRYRGPAPETNPVAPGPSWLFPRTVRAPGGRLLDETGSGLRRGPSRTPVPMGLARLSGFALEPQRRPRAPRPTRPKDGRPRSHDGGRIRIVAVEHGGYRSNSPSRTAGKLVRRLFTTRPHLFCAVRGADQTFPLERRLFRRSALAEAVDEPLDPESAPPLGETGRRSANDAPVRRPA